MAKRVLDLGQLRRLPIGERLKAVEEIWDSIVDESPDLAMPMSPVLAAQLDRRLSEYRSDPSSVVPWEDVRKELLDTIHRRRP